MNLIIATDIQFINMRKYYYIFYISYVKNSKNKIYTE